MAKDRKKLQHIHSSIPDKQPTAASLEVGEIAVNNSKDQEFLSIKNSNDKVVRFSSDEQIVTIMEKKEVIPYEGYTRGSNGPTGSTGPDSVTQSDLLNNKSNIIIKLNQVVADNTVKHNVVNGAKDIYNKDVNPTTDGGLTDGAGFAIDMSRYAMIGANPSFSSVTTTCKTTLQGTTKILGTNGSCGSSLDVNVNTVGVTANTWGETITGKTEGITTRTTTVGTESLTVTGTTTEAHNGNVTITNGANVTTTTTGNVTETVNGSLTANTKGNVTVNTTGTTTENRTGNVTENNSNNYTVNTTGNTTMSSTGTTCINSQTTAALYGKVKTNVGLNCDDSAAATTTNVRGITTNISANTFNETVAGNATVDVNGNVTENTKGNVVINTTGTTTENRTGNVTENNSNNYTVNTTGNTTIHSEGNASITANLNICETADVNATFFGAEETKLGVNCDDTATATTTDIYGTTINMDGTNLNINESSTVITSCTKFEVNSNDIQFKQCSGNAGKIAFDYCDGFSAHTNAFTVQQCAAGGTVLINEDNTTINGDDLTINEKDDVIINTGDDLTINTSGDTMITTTGDTKIASTGDVCISSQDDAAFYGKTTTKLGVSCDGSVTTTATVQSTGTTNIYGPTTNLTANTYNVTASTANTSANTVNVTAKTEVHKSDAFTVSGTDACIVATDEVSIGGDINTFVGTNCDATEISDMTTIYGDTVTASGGNITVDAAEDVTIEAGDEVSVDGNKICIKANTDVNIGGDVNTKIGADCNGSSYSNNTTIYASSSVTISAPTTNITGNTVIDGTLDISKKGLTTKLSWTYGDVKTTGTCKNDGSTNFSGDTCFTIPRCASDINRAKLSWEYGKTCNYTGDTYDPGDNCTNSVSKTIRVPATIGDITNDFATLNDDCAASCLTVNGDVCVNGKITVSGGVFSTSDERKKENIEHIDGDSKMKVRNVSLKSFNFKDDLTKRKVYGVIAQEVEAAGLDELVYTDENGDKSVDYTSFFILRIAQLERMLGHTYRRIATLEGQLNEFMNNKK